jgi:predicted transcriptional regulator
MPTITVKLDKERASRLSQWARRRNISKSEVIRGLIDSAGPIETGRDLAACAAASEGKGLGLGRRRD